MPTPKYDNSAQLIPLSFTHPAFKGLNTEMGGGIVPQEWATKLDNAVYDESGRPAARKGWTSATTAAGSGTIMRLFEYYKADGSSEMLAATDSDLLNGLTGTVASIKGSLTISEGNVKFVNFNDKAVAFGVGTGGIPAVYTGGTFADITVNSGTAPTGGIGTSAFGRLWGVDTDGKTMRYSSLLDETRWTLDGSGDGGSFDFSKVWPAGQDRIVAIEEFGGDLVVFGENNTVILTDGQASELGIDPLALYVSDTLPGVGAVSQFAICRAAGDLWVLTKSGIVGLQREIVQKSTPFQNISKNVQSNIVQATASMADKDDITMTYNPEKSLVLAIFPDVDTCYAFDTRVPLEDGSYRCTSWNTDLQTAAYERTTLRNWYGSLTAAGGEIFTYSGNNDNGTEYFFDYESGWLDLGEEMNLYLKFVKRMTSFVFVAQNVEVTHKVLYDFSNQSYTLAKSASAGSRAEYNLPAALGGPVSGSTIAEYNEYNNPGAGSTVVEYGGGVSLRTLDAPLGSGGQYIKIGLRVNTESGDFTLQQINLYAKIGRLAT